MPTPLHDVFLARVVSEIQKQLASIQGPEASAVAQQIKNNGSARISFPETEYGVHDPDAQFQHRDARFPGVVIEVSYSQKQSALSYLADDYILGSDGEIRLVIGLDIAYDSNKASLLLWRPSVNKDEELYAMQSLNQVSKGQVVRGQKDLLNAG
jgi:hypothetical protein